MREASILTESNSVLEDEEKGWDIETLKSVLMRGGDLFCLGKDYDIKWFRINGHGRTEIWKFKKS